MVKKSTALLPGLFFSTIQKHICLFTPSPLHRGRLCCPPHRLTRRQPECPALRKHASVDGILKRERGR